jgi:aminopeptidase-like protein
MPPNQSNKTSTPSLATEMEYYFDRLWPICRSITGNGLRESLDIINEIVPLKITEVPSGAKVFDWTVPKEWNIIDAYILTPEGKKICDFKINNLHLVNYSVPVNVEISYKELLPHLFYIEELPDAIPYITTYYKETWGFCLSYTEFLVLPKEGQYKIVIDSSLKAGSLSYGECVLPGHSEKEVLFSTYLCHPSMANNELSGPLVQAFLYQKIAALEHRKYTYRFLFAPETIGVIAFLHEKGAHLKTHLDAGFVLTCCGDDADFVYKRSKKSDTLADRVAAHVLKYQATPFEVIPFSVGGSDERQYCSPGFNLPVGSLTRSMYQRYKEYHTSLDNKSFISFAAMERTCDVYFKIVEALEINDTYVSTVPFCEPQLGKRNLYPSSATPLQNREVIHNRMHLLSYADGEHDLLDIANLRGRSIQNFSKDVVDLVKEGLLQRKK